MKQTAKQRFHLVRRKVNLDMLARLGMMPGDAKDRVMALTPRD